ncbi:MAG: glycosyltransferase family 4 protein [Pseudomonadota bacterium]
MQRDTYKLSELLQAIGRYRRARNMGELKASVDQHVKIGYSANQLFKRLPDKSDAARCYTFERLERALATEKDAYRRLLYHNVLLRTDFTYARFLRAWHALAATDLSLIELHASWYALYVHRFTGMQCFSQSQWVKSGYLLRKLYHRVAAMARHSYAGQLESSVPPGASQTSQTPHYVVSTTEFLGETHSVRQQAVDLAAALEDHCGARVSIINAATPPRLQFGYFSDETAATFVGKFNKATVYSYGDKGFGFAQNPHIALNAQAFAWYAQRMAQLAPTGVISIGPGNILADCFSGSVPTLAFPYVSELPLSAAPLQCIVKPHAPVDDRLAERAGTRCADIKVIPTGFRLPQCDTPTERADFGFPATARIAIVVGMRLSWECDDAFLRVLDSAAQRHRDLHFVFVGPIDKPDEFLRHYPTLAGKVKLLGFRHDVLAITRACDLYINPFRQGGGTSAIFAMSAGLPVITKTGGDVADLWSGDDSAQGTAEFSARLSACLDDESVYDRLSKHALARWGVKSDMANMAQAIADLLAGGDCGTSVEAAA